MKQTYLFYDIETTGLNKAFDQVIQFAAIRTDEDFNELEQHEFYLKLNPDVIPSPRAFITHGISLDRLSQGPSEFEGITQIHQLINTPGTISVGYNSLGFDDEFLRFSFFRNLLKPYSHQYANGCSRFDIYPMTVMYFLFKNEALTWPKIDGKISMKLENINAVNNLATGNAHDALVDVKATLELAKRLKKYPDMWHYLLESFDKDKDHQRTAKLSTALTIQQHSFKEALMIDGSFGSSQQFQSFVLCIGRHNHYKNQSLWLRLDAEDFSEITPENLMEKTWVTRKKAGEPGLLLPTIPRFLIHLDQPRQDLIKKNLLWIQTNSALFQQIIDYYRDFTYPKIPNIDADAALYQMGFLLPHETQLCEKFHGLDLSQKKSMIREFHNPILREQAIRIIGRQDFSQLSEDSQQEYSAYISSVLEGHTILDYKGNSKLTPEAAIAEIDKIVIEESLEVSQQNLLNELKSYLLSGAKQWQ